MFIIQRSADVSEFKKNLRFFLDGVGGGRCMRGLYVDSSITTAR